MTGMGWVEPGKEPEGWQGLARDTFISHQQEEPEARVPAHSGE